MDMKRAEFGKRHFHHWHMIYLSCVSQSCGHGVVSLPDYPRRNESKCQSFCCVDHRYNDKSRITHINCTHITQTGKIPCPVSGATLVALLPWLDDCDDNDHHYYQQYDDGIAHPLPRILLQFLRVLECAHALLYVIGCVRNLEREDVNWHVSACY